MRGAHGRAPHIEHSPHQHQVGTDRIVGSFSWFVHTPNTQEILCYAEWLPNLFQTSSFDFIYCDLNLYEFENRVI